MSIGVHQGRRTLVAASALSDLAGGVSSHGAEGSNTPILCIMRAALQPHAPRWEEQLVPNRAEYTELPADPTRPSKSAPSPSTSRALQASAKKLEPLTCENSRPESAAGRGNEASEDSEGSSIHARCPERSESQISQHAQQKSASPRLPLDPLKRFCQGREFLLDDTEPRSQRRCRAGGTPLRLEARLLRAVHRHGLQLLWWLWRKWNHPIMVHGKRSLISAVTAPICTYNSPSSFLLTWAAIASRVPCRPTLCPFAQGFEQRVN